MRNREPNASSGGSAAISRLKTLLDSNGLIYQEHHGVIFGSMAYDDCSWNWQARLTSDGEFLALASYCPLNVSRGRRAAVAEYLTRVNWRLSFGNFDMDWDDGMIAYRTTIPCSGRSATARTVEQLIDINCLSMGAYIRGLLTVVCGDISPQRALRRVDRANQKQQERRCLKQKEAPPKTPATPASPPPRLTPPLGPSPSDN